MIHTTLKIVDKSDPEPAFPDLIATRDCVIHCNLDRAAILQGGMQSGRPSVAFVVDLPGGKTAFIETSYANFEMMAGAFKGAVMRWEEGR